MTAPAEWVGVLKTIRKHGTFPNWLDLNDMDAAITAAIAALRAQQEPVAVLRIPRPDSLDPITVYFEDYGPGQGRVTIACYGDAWTAYWGAMGDRTVREFVSQVHPDYLSAALLQLSGGSQRRRRYTDRIAAAVIRALATPPATPEPKR